MECDADVVVVGAGPAGCAAAWQLVDAGLRVLLLDRQEFPRFKACAGGLTIKTLRRLPYSVAPVVRVLADDFVAGVPGYPDKHWRGNEPVCAMTVRQEFDDYCFRQTLAKGAEFRRIGGIEALTEHADHVDLAVSGGDVIRARFVVGADGVHSQVRKLTGLFQPTGWAVALEACVPLARVRKPVDLCMDFHAVPFGYGWTFPKGDHVNVGLGTLRSREVPLSREALYDYAEQRLGTRELEHVKGFPLATGGHVGTPASERIALVGDAAGFVEPLICEGLHNAVWSGQLAASAIVEAHTRGDLRARYSRLIKPLQHDLYRSHQVAALFYRFSKLGNWLLRQYFGGRMMRAMAEGRLLTETPLFTPWRGRFGGLPASYQPLR